MRIPFRGRSGGGVGEDEVQERGQGVVELIVRDQQIVARRWRTAGTVAVVAIRLSHDIVRLVGAQCVVAPAA